MKLASMTAMAASMSSVETCSLRRIAARASDMRMMDSTWRTATGIPSRVTDSRRSSAYTWEIFGRSPEESFGRDETLRVRDVLPEHVLRDRLDVREGVRVFAVAAAAAAAAAVFSPSEARERVLARRVRVRLGVEPGVAPHVRPTTNLAALVQDRVDDVLGHAQDVEPAEDRIGGSTLSDVRDASYRPPTGLAAAMTEHRAWARHDARLGDGDGLLLHRLVDLTSGPGRSSCRTRRSDTRRDRPTPALRPPASTRA